MRSVVNFQQENDKKLPGQRERDEEQTETLFSLMSIQNLHHKPKEKQVSG